MMQSEVERMVEEFFRGQYEVEKFLGLRSGGQREVEGQEQGCRGSLPQQVSLNQYLQHSHECFHT